ncbi:helix-turn-helix domain-containing protein [Capnocytophaga canimorsus]|uniref:PIF1/RRM3 DNA helicase-like protein n=2 Tax=Capnocytophaga canimorsus TaxID=28188 RepID=A0A0B7IBA9_9FLAO|nr:helix-turn-helix domain-containing protein [Capnocytophaga canimorsus]CEN49055.1 PIF1/RRM3 DNA helicase-like protein [Capnocytophaga canimorsus]
MKQNALPLSEQIIALINQTHRNIFLTGKAGTGKTTLLQRVISQTYKNAVVVAPTGIAALNAGGVTIHSLFQLPFASFLPTFSTPSVINEKNRFENRSSLTKHFRMYKNKREIFENLELLIVDEVSMLRADVVDAMDFMLQTIRRNKKPFGGVQVLFIGDLLQLPPVVKNEEWEILRDYYTGMFFFQSKVITDYPLLYVELDKIHRQSDPQFISLLNHLRDNRLTTTDIQLLQSYVQPQFKPEPQSGFITLTTHNASADAINHREMATLTTPEWMYEAEIIGDFPEHMFPIERYIHLKAGARVMFIKNDLSAEKLFYNGKMGEVTALSEDEIQVTLDGGKTIIVERYEWENIRYRVNPTTKDIEEERLGTYTQYPLRLAWAITVHKSQGLTFEKAVLDLDRVFAGGQAYVALSRLRSLNGLVLLHPIPQMGIENSLEVYDYQKNKISKEQLHQVWEMGKTDFIKQQLLDSFLWDNFIGQWQLHSASYKGETGHKNKYQQWAVNQVAQVNHLGSIALKFTEQLRQLFATQTSTQTLYERFEKAYDYFFPQLKQLWYEILRVQGETQSLKKVKQFQGELYDLEMALLGVFRKLIKTKQIIKISQTDAPWDSKTIDTHQLKDLRQSLYLKVLEHLKENQLFVEQESTVKTSKEKSTKTPTHLITLAIWKATQSVALTAQKRMLSESTIYRHLIKLLQEEQIVITELLPKEAIDELTQTFEKEEDISLGNLHAVLQEKYTWDELRLFKTSFLKD